MAKNSRADILRERYAKIQKSSQNIQTGTLYIFENHRNNDFSLPVKSHCGKKMIGPRGRFTGDSYFLSFVKTGDIRMIQVLEHKAEDTPSVLKEASEGNMEKLILDQPEKFTVKGHTEHVVAETPGQKKLTEISGQNAGQTQPDVLLTENPLEGIDIIND